MAGRPHFLQAALSAPAGVSISVHGRACCLARQAELAVDSERRRRGLLGRASLPADAALIIAPSNAVHTFGMAFSIDVIFVSRDGRVLKIRPDVGRRRIALSWRAFAVVEMAAGGAARAGLKPGDRLVVAPAGVTP